MTEDELNVLLQRYEAAVKEAAGARMMSIRLDNLQKRLSDAENFKQKAVETYLAEAKVTNALRVYTRALQNEIDRLDPSGRKRSKSLPKEPPLAPEEAPL